MNTTRQLGEIERRLERRGQRGHVYLPPAGPAIVTTAERSEGRFAIIGPGPSRDAIRASVGKNANLRRWAEGLQAETGAGGPVPPVLWNTVHLVVTGATASHALLIALHHASEYDEHELDELRAAARGDANELEQAFAEVTGSTLPAPARAWLRRRGGPSPTSRDAEAPPAGPRQEGETILTRLAEWTRARPDEPGNLRLMMRGIARTWRHLDESKRKRTLEVAPGLSGTEWDALLAAVMEHVAWLTGYPRPDWVDEPARFNDPPRSFTESLKDNAICWSPGAFLRHGALADPRDLDARGGERWDWVPEVGRRTGAGSSGTGPAPGGRE